MCRAFRANRVWHLAILLPKSFGKTSSLQRIYDIQSLLQSSAVAVDSVQNFSTYIRIDMTQNKCNVTVASNLK